MVERKEQNKIISVCLSHLQQSLLSGINCQEVFFMKLDKHFKDIWNLARQRFCPVVSCSVSKLSFSVLGLLSCSLLFAL